MSKWLDDILDLAVWVGATAVAVLGAASTQSWDTREHRITNIASLIAIVVAALKTLKTSLGGAPPAQPNPPAVVNPVVQPAVNPNPANP